MSDCECDYTESFQGSRYLGLSISVAATSPMISSFLGSQRIFRRVQLEGRRGFV